jgi:hypothetical protein
MTDGVLPNVRLVVPCDQAVLDPRDGKWSVKHPWSVVMLPPGGVFPFRAEEVWVYAQLTDGVGEFDLQVEVVQVRDDDTRRFSGSGGRTRMTFPGGHQILAFDTAFRMTGVPFREPGFYEFRVVAEVEPDVFRPLAGATAVLRLLDRGGPRYVADSA